jgi:hypothetical protein
MKTATQQKELKSPDQVVDLLRMLVAIEMWKYGATQQQIAKRLTVAKSKVVEILSGLEK